MIFRDRSHCGLLGPSDVGKEVVLAGWVDALRDHGEVLFVHLRDRSGIVQVVFSPESSGEEVCALAGGLKGEYCVHVRGRVVKRMEGTENPGIVTGGIEVAAKELTILSKAGALPFQISEKSMMAGVSTKRDEAVAEDLRLQYRYLDLRRPTMQDHLIKRHRVVKTVRDFLDEQGFIEVETPMLTKSTPEGARDYLVPSRHYPKNFYALPQSPQLFKQLLMVSGMERYFQIVRCFRDEDLRPNRQPEFTQLDLEASFIDEEFLYALFEELSVRMFRIGGIELPRPYPRMTWLDAMNSTGSDRPDLRFGMTFKDAADIFSGTSYGIFKQILGRGGCIKGINVKGQSERLSKNVLQNEYAKEIVPGFGAKGMTWMRVVEEGLESNIVQFFSDFERQEILSRFEAEKGDVILMIADPSWSLVCSALGQLRLHLADRLGLIPAGLFCPLWVTDFPLFDATEQGVTSSHHPFTMPDRTDFDPENIEELLSLKSRAYDLVMNGEELGGGSIRINDRTLQNRIFKALGLSDTDVEEKFGFFLKALEYGAPPHGGIALGVDRVVAMILGTSSIREVIAFPKNRSAFCPLTEAPSAVAASQLAELGLLDLGGAQTLPGTTEQQDLIDSLSWVSRIALNDAERPAITAAVAGAQALADLVKNKCGDHEPMFSVVAVANRTREGTTPRVSAFAETGEIFKNAPAEKGGYFKVAGILE
ncbi:MAG: aspartate--tRNA ligase [Syntrophorhabdus aromaticivorans]|uniref:Aspartate--tRNA(Asp/Asn) ligase n=1 Tax=Syntrophorhabdus aromaticivorans TaxID=328301 RepID=A0A971M4Q2_9BACT|nr:aspartate--tRNA ligase [Syntrophorhabdus aromaticivorans]